MSSTRITSRPARSRSRSLTMRTTPLGLVALPEDATAMKANSTGRAMGGGRPRGAKPGPHRPAGQWRGSCGQCPGVGGIEGVGEGVEQVGLIAQQIGLTGEEGGDVALGEVVEQGQQLVADAVAPEGGIGVG